MLTPDDLEDYQLLKYSLRMKNKEKISKVYRVVPNSKRAAKSEESQELWLHGTKAKNVMGILNVGFKPSEIAGAHGHGVYLTDDCRMALEYGESMGRDGETPKMLKHLFVARVKRAGVRTSDLYRRITETFEEYMNAEPTLDEFGYSESLLDRNSMQQREKDFVQGKSDS